MSSGTSYRSDWQIVESCPFELTVNDLLLRVYWHLGTLKPNLSHFG